MEYNIEWVKGLRYSDLALCHCLSVMRLYHYNIRTPSDMSKSILLRDAEAPGIVKVTVLLKTRDNEKFQLTYFMNETEAEKFRLSVESDFTRHFSERGVY